MKFFLAPLCPVVTNSIVSLWRWVKIIDIRLSVIRGLPDVHQMCHVAVCQIAQWSMDLFSRYSEVVQEWICDVSSTTQFQDIVPRVFDAWVFVIWGISHQLACVVFVYEFMNYFGCMLGLETLGESLLDWWCPRSRCVHIEVTLGFVCQLLAVLIVSLLFQFRQLT